MECIPLADALDDKTPKSFNGWRSHPSGVSFSAEVYGEYNKASFNPIFIKKSEDTCQRLRVRLSGHWMFKSLQSEDKDILVEAMKEETYTFGDVVIKQGDKGDRLFIIDKGSFKCIRENEDTSQQLLKVYNEGEIFGELALIYNNNRSATMIANSQECWVFSLDRQTFNHIISNNTMKRNEEYMKMLGNVPILKTLDQYEKSRILDACIHWLYQDGDYIITEGEPGEEFFILLSGEAKATMNLEGFTDPQTVKEYNSGDYFGERALLNNATRAASIQAIGDWKCLVLKREDFKKLLGPIEHILKRNMKIYINYIH